MPAKGGEFGLFIGGTICNAACPGCNVSIDSIKASGAKPQVYDKSTFLEQINQTFRVASQRGFDSIRLKYAGGEGLYMSRLALISQRDLADLSQKYGVGFTQQFLSNGGLTHAYMPVLKELAATHTGSKLEFNNSIWGLEDNHLRRKTKQVEWTRVLAGLKELEQAGLSWTLHYVMNDDSGDTLLRFMQGSLDTSNPNFFGKDWKKDPFRISVGIMRHDKPYDIGQVERSWQSIISVFNWMREAYLHGVDIPNPFAFFDYLMHPSYDQDGNTYVIPTDRTCGTGINFAAATPAGFARCHELLNNSSKLSQNLEETLLPTSTEDPFSTDRINVDNNMPVAAALSLAFGGGGCPNDDWLYSSDHDTSFGPLQYELYAPTTFALTLNGILHGRSKELSLVGNYILQVGDSLSWDDHNKGVIHGVEESVIQASRSLFPDFFTKLVELQPLLIQNNLTALIEEIGSEREAMAQCCRVWLYTIDRLDKELNGKIYRDIDLANDFRAWVEQLYQILVPNN